MKTAVSIPDPVFRSAERMAKRMKIPRSRLYAEALSAYVRRSEAAGITERIDRFIEENGGIGLDPDAAALQARSMPKGSW